MTRPTVLVCHGAVAKHWQLGRLPSDPGRFTLINWWRTNDPDEGGMSPVLVGALASALTSVSRITFLSSEHSAEQQRAAGTGWMVVDGDYVRVIPAGGLVERAQLTNSPGAIVQLSTTRAEVARRFFDDAEYPLWLQVQVGLLSAPELAPPVVDRKTLLKLSQDNWIDAAATLTGAGVLALLRPGVDGEMLGLLCLDDAFGPTMLRAMKSAVQSAGFGWEEVSEEDM